MKKVLLGLALASMSSMVMAQNDGAGCHNANKYEVLTNGFWDNWFISAGGGGEILFGNHDQLGKFENRISPTFNVALGKWFTPGLGLRMQYSGFQARGYTTDANNGYVVYKTTQVAGRNDYKQKFHYMNLHGDVLFNLNALFGGYNPKRVYEIIPYLGAGFTYSYTAKPHHQKTMAVNAGIINRFRVSSALDINIELSGMATEGRFDLEPGGKRSFDATAAATAGLTYHFKQRGFSKAKVVDNSLCESELANIRGKMNKLASENNRLKDELANIKPVKVVETEEVMIIPDIAPHAIFFTIGSAKVSDQEKINLGFFADQIKPFPQMKLKLSGYADSATGSKELNEKLSAKRAEAVAEILEKDYNVDRSRITFEGEGGVNIYDKVYLNRMVQIDVTK